MKKILGLDLGTNSIGWAVINHDFENKSGFIKGLGSRIIPMSQDILGKFDSGQSISQTGERTNYRGVRRLYQRSNLRRERLHRVLNILDFLPEHYRMSIDFEKKIGQFKKGYEPKINYIKNNNKYEFLFMVSYNEMINDFKKENPDLFYLKKNGEETKIPYDWTIYYLRKKALFQKITEQELAWILLNFNQKRGYYQLRGEDNENSESKNKTYEILKVKKVIETGDIIKKTGEKLYEIIFENGWKYHKTTTKPENWLNKTKEFIVTTSVTKTGEIKRSFKAVDAEKDWIAIKKKTEQDLDNYIKEKNGTVGSFIYDTLLKTPTQKIRGKLIKTIERNYYRNELVAILKKQIEFHEKIDINTEEGKRLYSKSINELYRHNKNHKKNIENKGFLYLFTDDIIFYQRPLKSQKSNISQCQYEKIVMRDSNGNKLKDNDSNPIYKNLRAIPKSHPLFQEFRLWQFLKNLKIYQKEKNINGKIRIDYEVTDEIFTKEEDWVKLFDFLNSKKEIKQSQLVDFLIKEKYIDKLEKDNYRWNYVEDRAYPTAETRTMILSRLKKTDRLDVAEISNNFIINLWHIIYSVKDQKEFIKALRTFAKKNKIDQDSFVKNFEKFPPFKSDYGAYSQKAIKKLLPLMRRGKYWNEKNILPEIKERIKSISERLESINYDKTKIKQISDDDIQKQVLNSFIELKNTNLFSGLNTYQAVYAVYGRHSEISDVIKWKSPEDIDKYLSKFKQHSLRNPIVEQVITETLRTVRDIWKTYGDFDEIHIELGRELKNPAEKRKLITQKNTENQNTNYRIREILKELMSEGIPDVKYYSPSHQEILKIYEEGVSQNPNVSYQKLSEDDVNKIRKNPKPSKNEIIKYKLWLEQGYVSPYTGQIIALNELFSTKYQIEHIIPQSRYFDNSLSNKVICESEVNELKSNQTAYEFISNHHGQIINVAGGKQVKILEIDEYENHCNKYFKNNKQKLKKLLSEDIPENFIERQINDTRYISKVVKSLLSNIVREKNEMTDISKNVIPVTGSITSKLKQDWGLNDKWNEIILARFERLNKLTNTTDFTYINENGQLVPTVPDTLKKDFNKKRIDHRHHALDALVIACTNRKHIQYLNSLNNDKIKYELQPSLLIKNKKGSYTKHFIPPWENFAIETKEKLQKTIISFKQNLRVINKSKNKYWKWVEKDGQFKKQLVEQTKGDYWSIRKSLHKETVSGKINIKTPKGKLATAVRAPLSEIKNKKHLEKITDQGIKKILKNHLKNYIDDTGKPAYEEAFSPEGIETLNKNIIHLNKGKNHKPIYRVRQYEIGNKFPLSDNPQSNKSKKYVEAAKGTNLYFAIYWNEKKRKREFATIPLNEVIAHQKQVAHLPKEQRTPVPLINDKKLLFTLSPNDLVYIPSDEEITNPNLIDFKKLNAEQSDRIYKMVSSTGIQCFFINSHVANSIYNKFEFSALNKMEKSVSGIMIKENCWKLKVDRLGRIVEINTGEKIIKETY